ncbi:Pr6Pr family membrane protein [Haloplasma contractile]|uniref:Integral membrane protein n=1 Tax=Haloplasma contractile SSD-17B TaxID=1033810 RepID=U2E8J1_9MOLU|nr:Pr6Pr family membrane protein [Haloplasma contractile]ERJ11483.1 Integral membrane protein [Haloplasma contractile SSD-17B]
MKGYKFAFVYRGILALLTFSGLVFNLIDQIQLGIDEGQLQHQIINYLGYFTIQSNLLIAIWLTASCIYTKRNQDHFLFKPIVKGGITLYISITGIIYVTMLAGLWEPTGIRAIGVFILHYLTPLGAFIDWLIFEKKRAYKWDFILVWMAYPLGYLMFCLIRGPLVDYYPYPFINVSVYGYNTVMMNAVKMTIFFILIGSVLVIFNNLITVQLDDRLEEERIG